MTQGYLIDKPTVVEAWMAGATRLISHAPAPTSMLVTAGTAAVHTRAKIRQLNRCADGAGAERPGPVSEVLIPARVLAAQGDLNARLTAGWNVFDRGRRRDLRFSGWKHTYFERLTGRWMPKNMNLQVIKENQLSSIIQKANSWGRDVEAALYAHTDLSSDTLRPRGSPCLQYVQFRLFNESHLELFALYRAHDYLNKALGNMIGLQRLGEFVGTETGRTLDSLTVVSLHPMIGGTKATLRDYVNDVGALPQV